MANPSPIAGLNPPGSSGLGPEAFQNTLTPGYTGGFGTSNILGGMIESEDPNVRMFGALGQIMGLRDEQAYEREERLFDKIQAMRKREAQEAEAMQRPYKVASLVGNQMSNIFENINRAVTPIRAYEMAIRADTPKLLAQTYASNPYAGRKWLA